MSKELYVQPGIVRAVYAPSSRTIWAAWEKLGGHDYIRPCCQAQLDCAKSDKAQVIIVDTSVATGTVSQEDQQWFGAFLFPEMQKAGIKAIITVLPASALTRMSTQRWKKTGEQSGMDFVEANNLEEAHAAARAYSK